MSNYCGPHNSGNFPFYISPNDPLSAESSVDHCVRCATSNDTRLEGMREDFRQIAYLTILEEEPKYDPQHPSGASFITFIKSRVCSRLWSERRRESKYLPFSHDESLAEDCDTNPLVSSLIADACNCESVVDIVCREIEVEQFQHFFPQMLSSLPEKERDVIMLRFFEHCSGVEISRKLSLSEGRVSQLTKTALSKLRKAYSRLISAEC